MPVVPFQKITVVRLVAPDVSPPDTAEDAEIQKAHIAYLSGLVEKGTILANGPVKRMDDQKMMGISLYLVGPDEARFIASDDPAVRAGWLRVVVDEWLVPAKPAVIGDRVDLEIDVPS